jgi:hypothetical protein
MQEMERKRKIIRGADPFDFLAVDEILDRNGSAGHEGKSGAIPFHPINTVIPGRYGDWTYRIAKELKCADKIVSCNLTSRACVPANAAP